MSASCSTRLCVKNLPGNASSHELQQLFAEIGKPTDLQLKYASDGKFRRFAFVGFASEELAAQALQKLNGAYLRSSKIVVEPCRELRDADGRRRRPQKETASRAQPAADDDELADEPADSTATAAILNSELAVKLKGCPPGTKAAAVREFLQPAKVQQVKFVKSGFAYARMASEEDVAKALKLNKMFMGKKRILVRRMQLSASAKEAVRLEAEAAQRQKQKAKAERQAPETEVDVKEALADNARLFVRNLPYELEEAELRELFEQFGEVTEVNLAYQSLLKRNKGFGFVSFLFPEHALKALKALDNSIFKGRNLHVLPAEARPEETEEAAAAAAASGAKLSSFQRQRLQRLRAAAPAAASSWNALFLGQDAVVDIVSEELGESKANFLRESGRSGGEGSVAVRLAHAEADLVGRTRRFLEENGVNLASFGRSGADASDKVARSDTVLLIKNLPAGVREQQLREETPLGDCPGLQRLLLPSHGVTAIAEFATAQEARSAFQRVAYCRFKDRPLFLEWAPSGVLRTRRPEQDEGNGEGEGEGEREEAETEEGQEASGAKLLVRNVAFQANAKELRALFSPFGEVVSVRLPKKPEGGHRGFCFVEFAAKQSARRAVKQLSGSAHLYGRRLLLEFSGGEDSEARAASAGRRRAELATRADAAVRKRRRLVVDDQQLQPDDN